MLQLFPNLTNPLTILSFAGIFAGLGLGSNTDEIIYQRLHWF
jgi:uncharacterized membrane protein